MPQIGWLELIIIIGLSIVIIGPKDFPVVLKKIGSWFGSVKRYVNNLQNEMTNLEENSIEINNQTFDINNPSENEEKKVDFCINCLCFGTDFFGREIVFPIGTLNL